jgi:hypothetical protein
MNQEQEQEDKRKEIHRLLKPIDLKSHLPAYLRAEIEREEIYTDFVLNYLISKRNGIGKIDSLVLKVNGSNLSFSHFLRNLKAAEYGYVEILEKNEKWIKLKLTAEGISHYNYISKKYRTAKPLVLLRVFLFVKKSLNNLFSFIFNDIPYYLKVFSESGIAKFTLFVLAVLTFILKWKEIKELIHIWTK